MKSFKFLPILALLFLISCGEQKEADDVDDMADQAKVQDPGEINKQWIDSWNRNDVATLDSLTASDAILYMQGNTVHIDSIKAWYKESAPMMKDLRTSSEHSFSGKDLAYDAGTYSHGVKGDTTGMTYEGSYTFVWKKTGNNWKLQVLNITDKVQDSTSREMEDN